MYVCIIKTRANVFLNKYSKQMKTATKKRVRVRRSEELTDELKKAFAEKVASFKLKTDAAEFFGITTVTIDNITLRGTAKPKTIIGIQKKIGTATQAA